MFNRGSVSVILRACSFLGIWLPGGITRAVLAVGASVPAAREREGTRACCRTLERGVF